MKRLLLIFIAISVLCTVKGQVNIYPYLKTVKQSVYRNGVERLFLSIDSILPPGEPPQEPGSPGETTDTLGFTVADYYVSSSGSDAADGLTPGTAWKTLARVQTAITAGTFVPGDTIAFRRDDKFTGTLTFTNTDGTAGNPIVFGTYENGQRPIITNMDTLSSWTYHKSHVYYASVAGNPSMVRFLYLNGQRLNKGRIPNSPSLYTINRHVGETVFVSNALNAAPNYWNGASVVAHGGYEWELVRREISRANEDTIIMASSAFYGLDSLGGFFFSDDTTCLDQHGEWCYDENNYRIYIYLTNDPSTYTISCDVNTTYINIANSDYIQFDGLEFIGGNYAVLGDESDNLVINSCSFKSFYRSVWLTYSYDCTVSNSNFIYATQAGLTYGRLYRSFITNNYFEHIGSDYESAEDGDYGEGLIAINIRYDWDAGLNNNIGSDSVVISKNEVYKTGYSGVHVSQGNKIYITQNKILHPNFLKQDGGGIYLWNCDTIVAHGGHGTGYDSCYVYRNYVKFDIDSGLSLLGERNEDGSADTIYGTYALYCDDYCQRIGIYDNYFDGARSGIFLHNDYDMSIFNNKLLGRRNTKSNLLYSDAGGSGGFNQDRLDTRNNIITTFYDGNRAPAWCLYYNHGSAPPTYDVTSGNYFMALNTQYSSYTADDALQEYSASLGTATYNVAEWNSTSAWSDGTDDSAPFLYSSTGLSTVDSMAVMYYNFSDTVYPLNVNNYFGTRYFYYNHNRVDYTDSLSNIQPYTGLLLLRSYNQQFPPDETPPDTVKYFTLSSPARDSILLSLIGFATDVDSIRINYNLGFTYPSSRTAGTLYAAFGPVDTAAYHSMKTYIDAPTDTTYSFAVWSADAAGNWTVTPNRDQVQVDSTATPHIVFFEEAFDDSTNYIYDGANWRFVYEAGDSTAEFRDVTTSMLSRTCTLPGNTSLRFTFTITNANTEARLAFTDNSENIIVNYANYANGTHEVTGSTDPNGSTRVAIYGSSGSPARWRITYLKVETNN